MSSYDFALSGEVLNETVATSGQYAATDMALSINSVHCVGSLTVIFRAQREVLIDYFQLVKAYSILILRCVIMFRAEGTSVVKRLFGTVDS